MISYHRHHRQHRARARSRPAWDEAAWGAALRAAQSEVACLTSIYLRKLSSDGRRIARRIHEGQRDRAAALAQAAVATRRRLSAVGVLWPLLHQLLLPHAPLGGATSFAMLGPSCRTAVATAAYAGARLCFPGLKRVARMLVEQFGEPVQKIQEGDTAHTVFVEERVLKAIEAASQSVSNGNVQEEVETALRTWPQVRCGHPAADNVARDGKTMLSSRGALRDRPSLRRAKLSYHTSRSRTGGATKTSGIRAAVRRKHEQVQYLMERHPFVDMKRRPAKKPADHANSRFVGVVGGGVRKARLHGHCAAGSGSGRLRIEHESVLVNFGQDQLC